METAEKVVLIVSIFGGFLWLRARARSVSPERQTGKVMVGIFLVLPALLVAESKAFERLHFGPLTDLLLKTLVVVGTIAAVGFGFLRPLPPGMGEAGEPDGGPGGTGDRPDR